MCNKNPQDDFLNKMTSEKSKKRTEPLKYIKESLPCRGDSKYRCYVKRRYQAELCQEWTEISREQEISRGAVRPQ